MGKYINLFKNYDKLYAENAPLIICARALTKDNESGKVFAQFKFKNINYKNIEAVKVMIKTFDTFGAEIEGVPEYQYLDLKAKRNDEFGGKTTIELPDERTRSFEVKCTEVFFEGGSSQKLDKSLEWYILPKQKTLGEKFGKEIAEQYKRDTFEKAEFEPDYFFDIWRCTCGTINKKDEERCNGCRNSIKNLLKALDREILAENFEKYKEEQKEKIEALKYEEEKKKKNNKKIAAIVLPIIALIVTGVVVFTTIIQPMQEYSAAVALMEEGKYEEAIVAFEAMDGYKDSAEQIANCENEIIEIEYQSAINLVEEGKYEEAITAFEAMGYKDSEEKVLEAKYLYAVVLIEEEKYEEAITAFEAIKNYKDSAEQIVNIRWLRTEKSLETVGIGKYIIFGEYEQDNDNSNGKEPIEWKILDIKDDKVFVVSKYAIAYMYYDDSWGEAKTWENCYLREWLNFSFIDVAFNEQEKGIIVETMVPADKNYKYGISGGNSTQDKIFILSLTEMNKYFDSYKYDFTDSLRAEKGVGVSIDLCLRTPGYDQDYVVTIDSDSGVLREGGEPLCYFKFIRPAMWIDLSLVE